MKSQAMSADGSKPLGADGSKALGTDGSKALGADGKHAVAVDGTASLDDIPVGVAVLQELILELSLLTSHHTLTDG